MDKEIQTVICQADLMILSMTFKSLFYKHHKFHYASEGYTHIRLP